MKLNSLLTGLISATTFLIGFLITGVISDYKESEKIPGDLASSLEIIYDEATILEKKKVKGSAEFLSFYKKFLDSLQNWFYKKERTYMVMDKISEMSNYFIEFELAGQTAGISRMKSEQSNIRKAILRIHTIRETNFVQSAYAIVQSLAFALIISLLLLKMDPFYEAAFFVTLISFMVLYMIFLITDLDNPFDYSETRIKGNEISLKPLTDLITGVNKKK